MTRCILTVFLFQSFYGQHCSFYLKGDAVKMAKMMLFCQVENVFARVYLINDLAYLNKLSKLSFLPKGIDCTVRCLVSSVQKPIKVVWPISRFSTETSSKGIYSKRRSPFWEILADSNTSCFRTNWLIRYRS